jgi:hypothetical protein
MKTPIIDYIIVVIFGIALGYGLAVWFTGY